MTNTGDVPNFRVVIKDWIIVESDELQSLIFGENHLINFIAWWDFFHFWNCLFDLGFPIYFGDEGNSKNVHAGINKWFPQSSDKTGIV